MTIQRRAFLPGGADGATAAGLSLLGTGTAVASAGLRGTAPTKPFATASPPAPSPGSRS